MVFELKLETYFFKKNYFFFFCFAFVVFCVLYLIMLFVCLELKRLTRRYSPEVLQRKYYGVLIAWYTQGACSNAILTLVSVETRKT